MRVLVIYAHPVESSFCHALFERVVQTLDEGGHEIRPLDLYATDFQPILTRQERIDYHTLGTNEVNVAEHIAHIHWAEGLIFVYPTWWYGPPAMLKGWLERVWVPHVTFTMPTADQPIAGLMQHIRLLGGVSTYGATWLWTRLVGDPGRRTLLRGLRPLCHRRCRTFWLAHYKMDLSTPASRSAYLDKVACRIARI